MAIIITDGIEKYGGISTLPQYFWDEGGATINPGFTGRFGVGNAAGFQGAGYHLTKTFGSNKTRIIFGGGVQSYSVGANKIVIASLSDGTTQQLTFTRETDASIAIRRGNASGTIVLQTAAGVLPNGTGQETWRGVSFDVTIDNSAGAAEIFYEGVSLVSASSIDTQNTANAYATKISIGDRYSENGGFTYLWDDIYVFDDTGGINDAFPGDVRVYTLVPNALGSVDDFTVGAGNAAPNQFLNVGVNNGDGWYNYANTAGNKFEYALGNLPSNFAGDILAIFQSWSARKDDAGVRTARANLNSNSVIANGATQTLAGGYQMWGDMYELNPDGSVAWTKTTVDALKLQGEVVA